MAQVIIASTELLKPSSSLQNPSKFKLTMFDRVSRHIPYQLRVLFYRPPHSAPFEHIIHLLKRSLAEVLVTFYPLTGRILLDDPVLELDCGLGQSIKFTEAITESTLDQLGDFAPSEFTTSLCGIGSTRPTYPWSQDDPLLFVQVTKFGCGGISLGFAFSHQAMDGVSAWHFMNSWAEVAKTGVVKIPPNITYRYKELEFTKEQLERVQSVHAPSSTSCVPRSQQPEVAAKVYTLDRSMIENLRAEAAATSDGTRFSTFEVVSAYFWRKITLARQLSESTLCTYIIVVNSRLRSLLLSMNYFGNAVYNLHVTLKAGEIERIKIGELAAHIHGRVAAWNENEVDQELLLSDWLQTKGPSKTEHRVQSIGSLRHPVYETDFGFGKPVGVTLGASNVVDGNMHLFPTPEGDGAFVSVSLYSDVLQRLIQQDKS